MKNLRPCRMGMYSEDRQQETLNEGNLALFIDNNLQFIYNANYIPSKKWLLEKMLNDAYEAGAKSVSNDIKEILNIK